MAFLSSTLAVGNTTCFPDFPADLTLIADGDKNDREIRHNVERPDFDFTRRPVKDTSSNQLGVQKTNEEREAWRQNLRLTNPRYDKLRKMQDAMRSIKANVGFGKEHTSNSDKNVSENTRVAFELRTTCNRLLTVVQRYKEKKMEYEKNTIWKDYAWMLSPKSVETCMEEMTTFVGRLESLNRRLPHVAVRLQQPPSQGLQIPCELHEDATTLLGGASLQTSMEILTAMDEVANCLAISLKGAQKEEILSLVRHIEAERNHVVSMTERLRDATRLR